MRRLFIFLAGCTMRKPISWGCLAVLLYATPLQAEMVQTAVAGYWTAYEGTTESGVAACVVSTHDDLGRVFMIKYFDRSHHLVIQIAKGSWQIPAQTRIPIQMKIDNFSVWTAAAEGAGNYLWFDIGIDQFLQFNKEFRAAPAFRLEFPGNEPEMVESLVGSRVANDAQLDCMEKLLDPRRITQPYDSRQAGPSQPFASPPPAPSRSEPSAAPTPATEPL